MDSYYKIGLIASVILILGSAYVLVSQLIKARREAKEKIIEYSRLLSQKKSSEVRLGQISEKLVPFLKFFKYDPKNAYFIGMPIDYIVFEDDKIIFVEIKTGDSALSKKQNAIKNIIKNKNVEFEIIRIK